MAIAFDATNTWASVNPGTNLTASHTCTGSNLILFIGILTTNNDITSVTYNGVAATQVAQVQGSFDSRFLTLYALANPSTGANTISVSTTSSSLIQFGAASYTGAAQTTTADNSTNNASGSDPFTLTLTPVADNCWTLMLCRFQNSTITAGSGTTKRAASSFTGILDSNAAITPPASTSLNATASAGSAYGLMISFAPFAAAAAGQEDWPGFQVRGFRSWRY